MKIITQLSAVSVILFAMMASNMAFAKLNIVSDYGGNSMGEFYDMLDPQDEYSETQHQQLATENVLTHDGMYLPVHSNRLSPSEFASYPVDYPTLQPFIIIGNDALSIKWLKARANDLETIPGLVGVVVNIDDANQLNTLKTLTNIPLYAMPGDELAERFDITHYPALITHQSVEQ